MANNRFLLVQMRDDDYMSRHELKCFARAADVPETCFTLVDARTDPMSTDWFQGHDAVFVGGSGEYSVSKRPPFLDRLAGFMRQAVEYQIPTLGVCFGFHVLAYAFGAPVVAEDRCSETGTFRIDCTPEASRDPLFAILPDAFYGHQGHNDSVMEMVPGLVSLARSRRCPHQACVVEGTPVYGIQFHPELRLADLKERLDYYGYLNSPERHALIKDNLHETPETELIIQKFIRQFVNPEARSVAR